MSAKKTAIILFNLGGPDKPESVRSFLFNLFNDKAIISLPQPFRFLLAKLISARRDKKAQKIYAQIGGKSPLFEITTSQAHSLEKKLSFFGGFKVFVCMRYWRPFSNEVIKKVADYNPDEIILLPLYPQFSSSTSGSSFEDFAKKISANKNKLNKNLVIKKVCCYPIEPEFIMSHAKLLKQEIAKLNGDFRILFSAHGLPQKLINQGDPYVFQIEKTAQNVIDKLSELLKNENFIREKLDYKICYQSKVGPLQWTSPSLDHEIRRAALDKKNVAIVPVAFVSDHCETLVELDIDYKKLAKKLGIAQYLRVPSLNIDGHFMNSLVEICKEVSKQNAVIFSGCDKKRICDKKLRLCPNA